MATQSPEITKEQLDRAICELSFAEFLKFVKILEPPTLTSRGGIIPFEMWEHIVEFNEILTTKRLVTVLKSRQLGFSWDLAAYCVWMGQYKEGANILVFSQGQVEATAFLGKCRTIQENLPAHLKVAVGRDNDTLMEFPSLKSKINALPSTEKAGRGETATLVIQDEADFHENLELNYAAVKPTIDQGGAQLIQCSTVNKKAPASLFKELYRGAPKNNFTAVFYGWMSRKDRNEKWYKRVQAEAPVTEGMSPEFYMEQEHPASAEEALRPSKVLAAFDSDALEAMQEDVKLPIETRNGVVNIYQKFAVGKRYSAGTDTSHGAGQDYSTTVIIDISTGYVVADVDSQSLSPAQLAFESVNLLKDYENPVWAIESNDWGIATLDMAQELKYPRLYEAKNAQGLPSGTPGWHTNSATRPRLWGELIEAIRERLIIVPSQNGLSQFTTVIRNPEKDGRIEAMVGTHDDYPMAVGLAWKVREDAYRRNSTIKVRSRSRKRRGRTRETVTANSRW